MAAGRILLPCMPALDRNGNPVEGALLYFYENQTTTPQNVYSDVGLVTPLSNPVVADSAGQFPSIFADNADLYSVRGFDPDGPQLPDAAFDYVQASIIIAYPNTLTISPYGQALIISADSVSARDLLEVPFAITPENYGYRGVDVTTDRAAFVAAQAASLAADVPLTLTATNYSLGTTGFVALGAVNYHAVGDSVTLSGAILADATTVLSGGPININFNNGSLNRVDPLSSTYKASVADFAQKALYLPESAQDKPLYKALDPSTDFLYSQNLFPNSDDWSTPTGAAISSTGVGFSLTVVNQWRAATIPAQQVSELNCTISGTSLLRGVVVTCSSGAFVFYAPDSGGPGSWYFKLPGVPVSSTTNQDWDGRATHASWYGANVDWCVRLYDYKTIGVVINGFEVFRYTIPSGMILRAGFCVMRQGSDQPTALEYFTAVRRKYPQGGQVVKVAIYGDSKSAPVHGVWQDSFRDALDGSAGVRVHSIVNYAVSGQGSGQQLVVMTNNPPTGMTDVFIGVGTNDIQSGVVSGATAYANVKAMVDLAQGLGCRVHILVPDLWYPKSLVAGYGEDTLNYQAGAQIRAAILNLAAAEGCGVIELPKMFGQVLADWRNTPDGSDVRVKDNIHPTNFTYRLIGNDCAKSVVREAARAFKFDMPLTALPSGFSNGWTADGTNVPSVSLSTDGVVTLSGNILAGTLTDGILVYTLPRNLWPEASGNYPAANGAAFVTIALSATDGGLRILNAAGSTFLSLDAISYRITDPFA